MAASTRKKSSGWSGWFWALLAGAGLVALGLVISRIDFGSVAGSVPQPDRFVYTFHVQGQEVIVGEHDLTPDLQQLARLLLP